MTAFDTVGVRGSRPLAPTIALDGLAQSSDQSSNIDDIPTESIESLCRSSSSTQLNKAVLWRSDIERRKAAVDANQDGYAESQEEEQITAESSRRYAFFIRKRHGASLETG